MRYFVTLDNAEVSVDITPVPGGAVDVRVDDRRVDAEIIEVPDGFLVRVRNHVIDLTIEGKPPAFGIVASGHRAYVKVQSERQKAAKPNQDSNTDHSDRAIVSPMPGRIAKVLVQEGQQVAVGDPVIVLEAMKMENELRAPCKGCVAKIPICVGDHVEGNVTLVEFS